MSKKTTVIVIKAVDNASRTIKRVQRNLLGAFVSSPALAVAGLAGLGYALKDVAGKAMGFSKGISEIKGLNITKSISNIGKEVKNLSTAFGQNQTDTIKAYYDAISAGVKDSNITGFMSEASKLALAGATDISTSTDLLTSLRNVYRDLTDKEIASFANATKNLGKITIPELAEGLGTVAPMAKTAGVGLNELLAGVVSLTKQGISSEKAMTGLRAVMNSLISPSAEAKKSASELGEDFSISALKAKGFAKFMADLIPKLEGNDEAIANLFGNVRAFNAMAVLAANGGKEFEDALSGMNKELESGALDKAVKTMKEADNFTFDQMKAQFEALRVEIGSALMPVLKDLFAWMRDFIGSAREIIEPISQWISANKLLIKGIAAGLVILKLEMAMKSFAIATKGVIIAETSLGTLIRANTLSYQIFTATGVTPLNAALLTLKANFTASSVSALALNAAMAAGVIGAIALVGWMAKLSLELKQVSDGANDAELASLANGMKSVKDAAKAMVEDGLNPSQIRNIGKSFEIFGQKLDGTKLQTEAQQRAALELSMALNSLKARYGENAQKIVDYATKNGTVALSFDRLNSAMINADKILNKLNKTTEKASSGESGGVKSFIPTDADLGKLSQLQSAIKATADRAALIGLEGKARDEAILQQQINNYKASFKNFEQNEQAKTALAEFEAQRRAEITSTYSLAEQEAEKEKAVQLAELEMQYRDEAIQRINDYYMTKEQQRVFDLERELEVNAQKMELETLSDETLRTLMLERSMLEEQLRTARQEAEAEDITAREEANILASEQFNQAWQGAIEGVTSAASNLAFDIITGQGNIADKAKAAAKQMASAWIKSLLDIGANWVKTLLIKKIQEKIGNKISTKVNSANTFTAQMVANSQAPWPLNLAAPAISAQMAAITTAGGLVGGMSEGGIVPNLPGANPYEDSVLAMLQPGERVLTQEQATQAGEGNAEGGSGTLNAFIMPSDPSMLGDLIESLSDAVERYGYRLTATEVLT